MKLWRNILDFLLQRNKCQPYLTPRVLKGNLCFMCQGLLRNCYYSNCLFIVNKKLFIDAKCMLNMQYLFLSWVFLDPYGLVSVHRWPVHKITVALSLGGGTICNFSVNIRDRFPGPMVLDAFFHNKTENYFENFEYFFLTTSTRGLKNRKNPL